MQKRKLYLLIFVICSYFLFQVPDLYNWSENKDSQFQLGLSGEHATVEWFRIYDDPDSYWDQAEDVTIDSFGNVYCVGYTDGNMILWKYNSKGDYILNRTWHFGSDYADAKAVALDSLNNIYVAGQISLREEMFLLKYNYDCELQWARIWGGPQEDPLKDMAIDSLDNIYLVGGTESFSVGGYDMCVVKYDSSGNQLWNRTWGGWAHDACSNIVIDSSDNIILGGNTASYASSYTDMCLVKYNSLGELQWDMVWERAGNHYEFNDGVVLDSYGNIFAAAADHNTFSPILVKFDNSGNEIWNRTYPELGIYEVREMEIDAFDNIYTASSSSDFEFAKFNKFGDLQWEETWGTADNEFCTSMALNSTNHMYLAGYRSFTSYGPMVLVKFKINPLDAPYFTDSPQDFSIYENDNTKTITWTPMDDSYLYDSYWILQDGIKVEEGNWNSSQIIYSNLAKLTAGVYNFTCFVNNSYGKSNSSSIEITVLPNVHIPDIYKNTGDSVLNIGTSNYVLSWHAYDLDGNNDTFQIRRNSGIIDAGIWNNDTDILFTETEVLPVGLYNYTCIVSDTSRAINQSSIFITIINHDPLIINNTDNYSLNYGTIGYTLSWYVSDPDGNTQNYWIELNSVIIDTGTWMNNSNIDYVETNLLSPGLYNYTCFISDTAGVVNHSSIFVEINSYPYFSAIVVPNNNIYNPNVDYTFNCSFFDDDGTIEEVYFEFNSNNYTVTDNYLGEYTYSLNDLAANENGYSFRWHAKDDDGAWTTTDWQVFTLYKRAVQLQILFNGTVDNYFYHNNPLVNITVINLNFTSGLLKLFSDNKLIQEEYDFSLVNFSMYFDGTYNITAILVDENYTGNAMKWLNIREIDPPEILFEFNYYYLSLTQPEYYDNEIQITITVVDSSPILWAYCSEDSSGIFVNRTMTDLGNGNWTCTVDISSLNWNDVFFFSFYANDTRGNIGYNDNATELYKIQINDFQKPVTTLVFTPHEGVNVILKSTFLSLTSDDNLGSGISTIRYKINNSGWYYYHAPFNFSTYELGYYEISYYAVDVAGNIEITNSFIVQLVEESQPPPTPPEQAIPGFNVFIVLATLGLALIYLTKRKLIFCFKH